MREIKFRAWDGERLKKVNAIGWFEGEVDWIDTPKYHGSFESDMELMQYTGLKDKHGVEIYEGDVVIEKIRYTGVKPIVKRRVVENDTVNPSFCMVDIHSDIDVEYDFVKCGLTELEVIGNIYEDSKLLEANQ